MAPHTSNDLRERMVIWSVEFGKKTDEIAELAGCSERTVREVLRLHRDFGEVRNPLAQRRGAPRSLDMGDLNYLSALLQAQPTLYLDELQEKLLAERNNSVSIATLSRAIRGLNLSHKRVSKQAAERNELLRAIWMAEYGDIPADYCVWLDESSVDDRTNQRTHGWAPLGAACVQRATFIRGQRYSVLPALTADGLIACDIFEGSVTKEKFVRFLNEDLVRLYLGCFASFDCHLM
jgi:transposase